MTVCISRLNPHTISRHATKREALLPGNLLLHGSDGRQAVQAFCCHALSCMSCESLT